MDRMTEERICLVSVTVLVVVLLMLRSCLPVHPMEKPRPETPPESLYH